jgi:hypothetical protein
VGPAGIADDQQRLGAVRDTSLSRSISPHGRNADPVVARQLEQWQLNAATNASGISNSTALHPHRA